MPRLIALLDVVLRHVAPRGLVDREPQARIHRGSPPPIARRDRDFRDEAGEDLAALGVLAALAVLDVRPFAVTGHECVAAAYAWKTRSLAAAMERSRIRLFDWPLCTASHGGLMTEPLLDRQVAATSNCCLLPALANRHGLITGATGTGKTVTLQTLAEKLLAHRRAGVHGRRQGRPHRHQPGRQRRRRSWPRRLKERGLDRARARAPARSRSGTCSASRAIRCAPPSPTWGRCCWRACST